MAPIVVGGSTAGAAAQGGKQEQHEMLRRKIPAAADGESVPVIGMGTWNTFDVGDSAAEREPLKRVLEVFYESGARLIDSSPMYGNAERVTGDLVQQLGMAPVHNSAEVARLATHHESCVLLGNAQHARAMPEEYKVG